MTTNPTSYSVTHLTKMRFWPASYETRDPLCCPAPLLLLILATSLTTAAPSSMKAWAVGQVGCSTTRGRPPARQQHREQQSGPTRVGNGVNIACTHTLACSWCFNGKR